MADVPRVSLDDMDAGRARALRLIAASLGGERSELAAVIGELANMESEARIVAAAALIENLTLFGELMARSAAAATGTEPLDMLSEFDTVIEKHEREDNDAG